ncbi:hypothetical protein JQ595_31120 [Bradyrhizobium japonicum]|uniref:hypothetical protein n=1 Tax=Bradyrhizobium japonicum TaxID=375 RepID=UPI001BAC23B5|nr:hypothetical protein [Bradyrhizobium japonicum]MBR0733212.1 hypothetical protein [Bradyrhizobium japonicum]
MIKDQTIGSARAEKDQADSRIMQRLMTALLASALMLPSLAAWGTESSPDRDRARAGDMLRLPPIRYLDSMPWMNWKASAPTLRIDTLMSPSITPWGVLKLPQDLTSSTLS